ncbi:MAG: class 1 isoprenoid biosynthesis enzyme [Patescibacteria group bacterium]
MKTIFLGLKLLVSLVIIEFRKPPYLRSKPISLKRLVMGPLILSRFIKVTKHFIHFVTTQKQQEEIIYWFFQMSSLIEKGFDDKDNSVILTPENFPDIIMLKNIDYKDALVGELTDIIRHIKKLTSSNNYDNFESNIIKTWLTHKVRDVKQAGDKTISLDDALRSAEDRGGFYFLALVYLLNPTNLDKNSERLVRLSGAWFQIIDDYDDRKKDVGNRSTPFTVPSNNSHKEMRKKYMAKYQKQIQTITSSRIHPLIIFFRGLAGLVTIKPIILGEKSDWH